MDIIEIPFEHAESVPLRVAPTTVIREMQLAAIVRRLGVTGEPEAVQRAAARAGLIKLSGMERLILEALGWV